MSTEKKTHANELDVEKKAHANELDVLKKGHAQNVAALSIEHARTSKIAAEHQSQRANNPSPSNRDHGPQGRDKVHSKYHA